MPPIVTVFFVEPFLFTAFRIVYVCQQLVWLAVFPVPRALTEINEIVLLDRNDRIQLLPYTIVEC